MTTIYFYSGANFEYAGTTSIVTGDPMPSNSTTVAPGGFVSGHVYKWNGSAWVSTADYRGFIYDTTTGERSVLSELTAMPAGYTNVVPTDFPYSPTDYDWSGSAWALNSGRQTARLAVVARQKRNDLLLASDFVETIGIPIENTQLEYFARYRQWLRDIPDQALFPDTITWPVVPSYTKQAIIPAVATRFTAIDTGRDYAIANPIP